MSRISSSSVALFSLLLCAFAWNPPQEGEVGETPRPSLEDELKAAVAGFEGEVGIYVRHLKTGEEAALSADETFPTASLIKLPILLGVFARIEAGELEYHGKLGYSEKRRYAGEDLLASFKDGEKIALSKLVDLMIAHSDNTASLWLQELAGTGTALNRRLAEWGFAATRVNSRTEGREKDYAAWGWGQTTPREMAEILLRIRGREAVSPAADDEMYRVLGRAYWDGEALSEIPPFVEAKSKQGAISHSRSEVVLVEAPSGPYVFCVITKNQKDRSWKDDNAGFVLLRRISALLWRRFEPGSDWSPAAGAARYR